MNELEAPARRTQFYTRNIVQRLITEAEATEEDLAEYLKALGIRPARVVELIEAKHH